MSLIDKIDELFASSGDAAQAGLKHLAGEIDQLKAGAAGAAQAAGLDPAKIEADIKAAVDGKLAELVKAAEGAFASQVTQFLAAAKAGVDGKVAELEADVTAALAKLHPQPAGPAVQPTAPAQPGGNPT
jgi:hypothetical protein